MFVNLRLTCLSLLAVVVLGSCSRMADVESTVGPTQRPAAVHSPDLADPVRLTADGVVIDSGKVWGHSSPCIEDVDGDGIRDLVVGDFSGKFRVYRNLGADNDPIYQEAGYLQADSNPAQVHIYCCIGGQPRFVDLNGDGIRDMISNSYDPGHCHFFRGLGDGSFAQPVEIVDRAGVPVRSEREQQQDFQSFGSFFAPVDWDADGDYDLLIGCFNGNLKLRINEGTPEEYAFAEDNALIEADGEPIKVDAHCCPTVADWDGDGQWDVVVGANDGSVTWYRNIGTLSAPEFASGITLVEQHDGGGYNLLRWSDDDVVPGIRSQVEVADLNGDGKLDLLVGDFCTAYEPKDNLDPRQKQELQTAIDESALVGKEFFEKLNQLRKDFEARYPGEAAHSEEATAYWNKEYFALGRSREAKLKDNQTATFARQVRPLLSRTHSDGDESHDLAMPHGYVWLYLRK